MDWLYEATFSYDRAQTRLAPGLRFNRPLVPLANNWQVEVEVILLSLPGETLGRGHNEWCVQEGICFPEGSEDGHSRSLWKAPDSIPSISNSRFSADRKCEWPQPGNRDSLLLI